MANKRVPNAQLANNKGTEYSLICQKPGPDGAAISTEKEIMERKTIVPLSPTKKKSEPKAPAFKLFPNLAGNEPKSETTNLFNIFENKNTAGQPLLFGNTVFQNASLFSSNAGSLFGSSENKGSFPLFQNTNKDDDEEEDGGENQIEIEKEKPALTVSKEASPYIKLSQFNVAKMKVGRKSLGNGVVSLEQTADKKLSLLVFRNMIGKVLYNGLVFPKISKVEIPSNGKSYKYDLYALCLLKENTATKKSVSKIRFNSSQDLVEFKSKFDAAFPEQSKVILSQQKPKTEINYNKLIVNPFEKKEDAKKDDSKKQEEPKAVKPKEEEPKKKDAVPTK